jgi:hypothetical protein
VIDIPKLKASVTFQANGGKGTMEALSVSIDNEVVVPECTFNAPTGKWCHSWAVNEPGGERIEAGSSYKFTNDTVLYAVWDDVLAENEIFTSGNGRYQVITTGEVNKVEGTVAYLGQVRKRTTAKVPDAVVYENITYLVTTVTEGAWRNNQALRKIVIGDNVTDIGEYAACNCPNLDTLKLGDSVKNIGKKAFYKCSSLEKVTIPASVTFIGTRAFRRCINLHTLNILTTNLTEGSVGYRAFPVRRTLINITVPESMIEIYQSLLPLKGVRQRAILKINS